MPDASFLFYFRQHTVEVKSRGAGWALPSLGRRMDLLVPIYRLYLEFTKKSYIRRLRDYGTNRPDLVTAHAAGFCAVGHGRCSYSAINAKRNRKIKNAY